MTFKDVVDIYEKKILEMKHINMCHKYLMK